MIIINLIEIISIMSSCIILQHLLELFTQPKYSKLVSIQDDILIISNHYQLLWAVLPKKTRKIISRSKFLKEVAKVSILDLSLEQRHAIANRDVIKVEPKSIFLKINNVQIKQRLFQIKQIMMKKNKQKVLLAHKITKIKQLLQTISHQPQDKQHFYELLQEISSLKSINYKIVCLNEGLQQNQLKYRSQLYRSRGQICLNRVNSIELMDEIKYLEKVTPKIRHLCSKQDLANRSMIEIS